MSEVTLEWMQKNPLATIGYIVELEAEREQASQDYADLLKDFRAQRKDAQAVVDNVTPWFSRTEEITNANSPTNYDVDAKYIDNLKATMLGSDSDE
jgi:hypothetical protein